MDIDIYKKYKINNLLKVIRIFLLEFFFLIISIFLKINLKIN